MRRALAFVAVVALALAGCGGDAVSADTGTEAWLMAHDGQFFHGPIPEENGGPPVVTVDVLVNRVHPGEIEFPFGGALSPKARAAAFALEGDVGHWVIQAGVPDVTAPKYPTYSTQLSFAADLPIKKRKLVVRAVDAAGHYGPESSTVLDVQPGVTPGGLLDVTLTWDTESDLDLRVVDPHGIEIWKRNINSWQPPPPGQPPDPNAWMTGAMLDFDSNADCVIDGRRRETVDWPQKPPKGHYVVKVDAFSLCGTSEANWQVDVVLEGKTIATAHGTALPSDTELPHDVGGGFFALGFDVR